MTKTYSLYEAKAKFSEIVRMVRERGMSVTISYHGKPVVEIRPIEEPSDDPFEKRWAEMIARGEILPGKPGPLILRPVATRPGALQRFLEDRD